MAANLKKYDKLITRCRQLLAHDRISRARNLVIMVMALLMSTDCHLRSLAEVIPWPAAELSIEQRLRRWLKNEHIDMRVWFAPLVRAALAGYRPDVVYVVMDTTPYGPNCRALIVGVAYAGQVLPLSWRVVKGKKGHTPPALQKELLAEIRPYLPPDRPVVLIADSEFGAVEVLTTVTALQVTSCKSLQLPAFKGRGFRLGQTRLPDPERLSRLLLTDRSFFQLGYRYLKRLLKLDKPLLVMFRIHPH